MLQQWSQFLERIGTGIEPHLHHNIPSLPRDLIQIPSNILSQSQDIETFISEIFPNLYSSPNYFQQKQPLIITPLNIDTRQINQLCIDRMYGQSHTFPSVDTIENQDHCHTYTQHELNEYTPNDFPPHLLKLKVGAPIICLRNINSRQGLFNGTRLIVESWNQHVITARINHGPTKGTVVNIPRIKFFDHSGKKPYTMIRKQFPIRLCFSMTVHKSQGQTLKNKVGLYLPNPVFSHGMLYVAFSRVTTPRNLKVLVSQVDNRQGYFPPYNATFTSNVVYREIFKHIPQSSFTTQSHYRQLPTFSPPHIDTYTHQPSNIQIPFSIPTTHHSINTPSIQPTFLPTPVHPQSSFTTPSHYPQVPTFSPPHIDTYTHQPSNIQIASSIPTIHHSFNTTSIQPTFVPTPDHSHRFFERQTNGKLLCLQHALNNILGTSYVDQNSLNNAAQYWLNQFYQPNHLYNQHTGFYELIVLYKWCHSHDFNHTSIDSEFTDTEYHIHDTTFKGYILHVPGHYVSINYDHIIKSYVFYDSLLTTPLLLGSKENMISFLNVKYNIYTIKMISKLRRGEITNGFQQF